MTHDTVRELRVRGLRTVRDVRLTLGPLTMLTGENGSGKSTLIESCEILRKAASPDFLSEFVRIHGGLEAFRTHGAKEVVLGIRIEGGGDPLDYSFHIENVVGLAIVRESLLLHRSDGSSVQILSRENRSGSVLDAASNKIVNLRPIPGAQLLLTGFGLFPPNPNISRMVNALRSIEVHVPFASLPRWVDRTVGGTTPSMRVSPAGQSQNRLETLGGNLANVFQSLRGETSWPRTMEYVRVGLGDDIRDVKVMPESQGDGLEIFLVYDAFDEHVPARSLSDGTLGYLAFVALSSLPTRRSLLAFDEPENQLHPGMSARVAEFFQVMSREQTILVATHSDRMLDALKDPADSVVLCALAKDRTTKLMRPDKDALNDWLASYRGWGEIRSGGHEKVLMIPDQN